jgi:hypothetical protein
MRIFARIGRSRPTCVDLGGMSSSNNNCRNRVIRPLEKTASTGIGKLFQHGTHRDTESIIRTAHRASSTLDKTHVRAPKRFKSIPPVRLKSA